METDEELVIKKLKKDQLIKHHHFHNTSHKHIYHDPAATKFQ
jgi:hypothetical protein